MAGGYGLVLQSSAVSHTHAPLSPPPPPPQAMAIPANVLAEVTDEFEQGGAAALKGTPLKRVQSVTFEVECATTSHIIRERLVSLGPTTPATPY